MDGFKNSTKTHYVKGGMCEGYATGGRVKKMAKGGSSSDEFSTDPAGNIARYERKVNTDSSGIGGSNISVGGVGMPVRTMTGQTLGRGVGATVSAPIGGIRRAKGGKVSGAAKIAKVMGEFKSGKLHSGSKKGPEVTNPKQAVAIAISEARKSGARVPVKKKGGGRIDRNMIESTSSRPTGRDIAPVDRLEGNETPRSVTVERRSVTVEPGKRYRGREGDIPVGPRTDREMRMTPSDLDRTLRTLPSERGEMRRGPAGAGFSVRPLVEMARDALGFKNGGLSKMPRGKKC